MGDILQLFHSEPIYTAAEIPAKKDLDGTSAIVTEFDAQSAHLVAFMVKN